MTALIDHVPLSPEDITRERALVLEEARSWLGTQFHHAQRVKGAGVDCAQFLIACYVGLGIVAPFDPGFYGADWFLHQDGERFRGWVERSCVAVDEPRPGDLLLFRFGRAESHGAIYLGDEQVIHAFRGITAHGVMIDACTPHTQLGVRHASTWTPARWAGRAR